MDTVILALHDVFHTVNQGCREGGRGQTAPEPQGLKDLIILNASRSGGPHIVSQQ